MKTKFSELPIGAQFETTILNGLSQLIGKEVMQKHDDKGAILVAQTWFLPESDHRVKLCRTNIGAYIVMQSGKFDPFVEVQP